MKFFLILIFLLAFFTGCSSVEKRGGENLSSAMSKSGNENSEERKVYTGKEVYSSSDRENEEEENSFIGEIISEILFGWIPDGSKKEKKIETVKIEIKENKIEPVERKKEPVVIENPEWIVAAENETSFYSGGDISYINRSGVSFKLGVPDGGPEFGIAFLAGKYGLKDSFKYKNSIRTDGILGIELNGKGCIKKLGKDLRLNAGFGLGMEAVYWKYKNSLYSDTEVITEDELGAGRLFGSIGVDYRKDDSIYLNFEIKPEIFMTEENTKQGFKNDVFEGHTGLGFKIEAGYAF